MHFKEIRSQDKDCIHLAQGRAQLRALSFLLLLPLWSIGLILSFLIILQTVGLLGRVISSSQGCYLNTRQHKHRKTHTHTHQTSMSWVGFEPKIPTSERAKTVHALDDSTSVTGWGRLGFPPPQKGGGAKYFLSTNIMFLDIIHLWR
jgi:hypothetical protein